MKPVFLLLFLFILPALSSAQLIYPEIMEVREPLTGPVVDLQSVPPSFPARLYYQRLNNRIIENPGVRYSIQSLKKERYPDIEVNRAINTLIRYAEDEHLKHVVDYLKRYTKTIPEKEKALQVLQQQITFDSIEFYKNNEHLLTGDYEEYLNTDMQTFVKYLHQDPNYQWLRNASRDSVLLQLLSSTNNTVRFWINTGRVEYHRFWAANKLGDTIGTWIQVMPNGKCLKIYVDEDVYKAAAIETKDVDHKDGILNPPTDFYQQLIPLKIGDLRRKYWTYYSEAEVAMSQGKLANWSSGGENSLSLLSNLRYFWNYNRNKTSWENWMHYRFGFMKNGSEDMRKNEDRFELNSKLGQKAFKHWYYTAQFNMLTQLFNSYEYPKDEERKLVANFMSPGYFTLSLGLDYKPNDRFSLFISPIAGKWNFVRDTAKIDANRYGVTEEGKRFKREAGAQLNVYSKVNNLLKIMNISNDLKLFMSYESKDRYVNKGQENEKKKRIPLTVNWKLNIDFKINYFMSASIYTETIYDENYSRKLQFKENLNLGVKFRF